MLNSEFYKVINGVPYIVAVFSVTKVPEWASEYLQIGDEVYWNEAKDSMRTLGKFGQPNGRKNLRIGASYLKFERFAPLK